MIYLGTDHRGFQLKEKIKTWLQEWGYDFQDLGAHEFDENDDYPDLVKPVAEKVSEDPNAMGIVLGGSGQGEAIVANRFKNVRAVVYYGGSEEMVKVTRLHNNSNILSIGAAVGNSAGEADPISEEVAKKVIKAWLETDFLGEERHARRIAKIESNLS
jgi:ribose 5-phosphate isomerase B